MFRHSTPSKFVLILVLKNRKELGMMLVVDEQTVFFRVSICDSNIACLIGDIGGATSQGFAASYTI